MNIKNIAISGLVLSLLLGTNTASSFFRNLDITSSNTYKNLLQKTKSGESVHIIVELAVNKQENFSEPLKTPERAKILKKEVTALQNIFLLTLKNYPINVTGKFKYIPALALEVDKKTLKKIARSSLITNIEEDGLFSPTLDDSIPVVNAETAWNLGYTGAGQAVAIIDSGVDSNHPFLAGKVISEACYSKSSGSLCPGGGTEETGSGTGMHCDPSITACSHGTHVAGIAAGKDGYYYGTPLNGVAKEASLIAIQIYTRYDSESECGGDPPCILAWSSDFKKGMERIIELQLDPTFETPIVATNLSFSNDIIYTDQNSCIAYSSSTKALIDDLIALGVAVVASAGNSGASNGLEYPACLPEVISVGNSKTDDTVYSTSNSASFLTMFAPGVSILSSKPNGEYGSKTGTSMAAPHVSGAAAIIRQLLPDSTVDEIRSILTDTGIPIFDDRNGLTFPRLDVGAAVSIECPTIESGDFVLNSICFIKNALTLPANLIINAGASLYIKNGASLDMDLGNQYLLVEQGGKVFLEENAKIY